jgi:hypothetical protein
MASKEQERIIALQRRLHIANTALSKIANGCRDHEGVAAAAMYDQMNYEPKRPLQGLVGHKSA